MTDKNLGSLKKVAEGKVQTDIAIKKVTNYMLDPRAISIEQGFNARNMERLSPRTRAYIDTLKVAIRAGDVMPPLDVRVSGDKIYVVDGHCRLTAYHELIAEGVEIAMIAVRQYNGNDDDRDFHVLNSASQLHLTRLEQGRMYKRRVAYGWTITRIAERAHKSPSYVEQNLRLANANSDLQQLLEDDLISAKVALDALRKHGEQAGAVLKAKLEGSASGKLKGESVTKAPPPKVTRRVLSSVDSFVAALPANATAFSLENTPDDQIVTIPVTAGALRALLEAHAATKKEGNE